jgi:hypothetical protein
MDDLVRPGADLRQQYPAFPDLRQQYPAFPDLRQQYPAFPCAGQREETLNVLARLHWTAFNAPVEHPLHGQKKQTLRSIAHSPQHP